MSFRHRESLAAIRCVRLEMMRLARDAKRHNEERFKHDFVALAKQHHRNLMVIKKAAA